MTKALEIAQVPDFFDANTTGIYFSGVVNAASHTIGSSFVANSVAIVSTGYANVTISVNSALFTVGSNFIANTTGTYHTGVVNAASHTVGSNFIANTTGVFANSFTVANTFDSASSMGFKNRIINGAMVISQRNGTSSITPTDGQYIVDRWKAGVTQASKFTAQQNAGSVTPPTGYINYLGVTSSSAYSSLATDQFYLTQPIEGLNVADLSFGTSGASSVAVSFWVRSSLTGTFSGTIGNDAFTRTYAFSFTISASNTWEQKTIAIAGDTSGTWLTNNGAGIWFTLDLGSGSNYATTANTWTAGGYRKSTGSTSIVGTNGATFYITGVQLEKGSTATSFDYRPYGTELMLCQRYFQKSYDQSNVPGTATRAGCVQLGSYSNTPTTMNNGVGFRFPVVMRAAPTMTGYDPDVASTTGQGRFDAAGVAATQGALTFSSLSDAGVASVAIATTGRTAGAGLTVLFHYTAAIEL